MALKRGAVVRVYQHPLTDEEYEGDAALLKRHRALDWGDNTGLECWSVQFSGPPGEPEVERQVHVRNVVV